MNITVWTGALSLGYWGYVGGVRAGFSRRQLAGAIAGGLLVGPVVRVLQVLSQPGNVFWGGAL